MGNESGDLDSVVSSLVYAYLLQTMATGNAPVIPVLNFLAKELPFKTEVVLTDHHVMPSHTAALRSSVVEVVDHHPQDPAWVWPPETTTLQKVGSCCTLVAKKVLDQCPKILDLQVASLLYGPIILDTACFNPTADKTTPLDLEMASELEKRGVDGSQKEQLFAELTQARSDISTLTPAQLLVKDLKVTSGIPMPGFPILVQVTRFKVLPESTEIRGESRWSRNTFQYSNCLLSIK
ncbi:Exopolyphosphatase PRUNE1 [Blattella germanica]|nr:Exopolyphosphatase PRUNE1 [Blattella germanica]